MKFIRQAIKKYRQFTQPENLEKFLYDDPLGYRQLLSQQPTASEGRLEQEVQSMFDGMDLLTGFPYIIKTKYPGGLS